MHEGADQVFLSFSLEKLKQLTARIEDCLGRLTPDEIWARAGANQNAVGNLVLHLCGNVRQWIISGVGGEPDTRVRDAEFAAGLGPDGDELAARLQATITRAVAIIEKITPERLIARIHIQDYDVTVLEAVYHVVEHFAQHTGQIIFAVKTITGANLGYYGHLSRAARHNEKTP